MKRLLRGLGSMAIILVVLVLVKNEYARLLMSHANHGLQALITSAEESRQEGAEKPYDLYIGSSMFRQGLDINELDAAGGNNYILAYNATQPFLVCKEVEYLLANDVPIQSITVDMYVYTVIEEPWIEDTRLLLDTNLQFKWGLWQEMRETASATPADLWELLVTSNNDKLLIWPIDYALVNPMFKSGGNLLVNGGTTSEALGGTGNIMASSEQATYSLNDRQVYYLRRLVELCDENGISLALLETPKYYTVNQQVEYVEVMHLYCDLLQELSVPYYITEVTADSLFANSYVDNANGADGTVSFDQTNPEYYMDLVHLSSVGREEFTRQYLERIESRK